MVMTPPYGWHQSDWWPTGIAYYFSPPPVVKTLPPPKRTAPPVRRAKPRPPPPPPKVEVRGKTPYVEVWIPPRFRVKKMPVKGLGNYSQRAADWHWHWRKYFDPRRDGLVSHQRGKGGEG
jgi:hypothetical protein